MLKNIKNLKKLLGTPNLVNEKNLIRKKKKKYFKKILKTPLKIILDPFFFFKK